MKIVRASLTMLALCLAVGAAAQDSRVSVVWANPEQYADLKTTCVCAEVRAGTRQLRDGNYLTGAAPDAADHLRYEKALLLEWLQKELPGSTGS